LRKADEDKFHGFVAARMDRWRRSAFLLCRDWHTADDLVSVTVGKVFENWRKVAAADNPDAYAQRILARSWLDERRRSWHREKPVDQLPELASPPDHRIEDHESLAALLDALGPRQRAVLVLRFYLNMSVEETADILRISPGTVKSQSARGLTSLRTLADSLRP
jgi:RNA polymerase sigma-70 factor (sigma-E family)